MNIASGLKIFDKQANKAGIMTGNVSSNVQHSSYVRAHNCLTKPNGDLCAPGEMQKWDLEKGMASSLPQSVKDQIKFYAETEQVIAYEFFYYSRKKKRVIGYSITRPGNPDTLLWSWNQHNSKAMFAMHEVNKIITGAKTKPQPKVTPLAIPVLNSVFVW